MEIALTLVTLIAIAIGGSVVAERYAVSTPLLLIVLGAAASYVPFVPDFKLTPTLVLVGLLPPLLYAASASTSPYPKWLFGTWSIPPHCVPLPTVMFGFAVLFRSAFVAAMSRTSAGFACQSRATTPTTCGPAIEVPENEA